MGQGERERDEEESEAGDHLRLGRRRMPVDAERVVDVIEALDSHEQRNEHRVEVKRDGAVVVEEARQVGRLEYVVGDEARVHEELGQLRHQVVHEVGEGEKGQVEDALLVDHLLAREHEGAQRVRHQADVVELGDGAEHVRAQWRQLDEYLAVVAAVVEEHVGSGSGSCTGTGSGGGQWRRPSRRSVVE